MLPLTFVDKVDSPEFVAWLSTFGPEKKLTAQEINSIRDAINLLYSSGSNNISNEFITPKYYYHNWLQIGESTINPFSVFPSNVNTRMEAPGMEPYFCISAVFEQPVLINKIIYAGGQLGVYGNLSNIKGFALLGSTLPTLANAAENLHSIVLHDTLISGHQQMNPNTSIEDWFNLKEITLGNPQIVRSISFFARSVWTGSRPTIVKLLFK